MKLRWLLFGYNYVILFASFKAVKTLSKGCFVRLDRVIA